VRYLKLIIAEHHSNSIGLLSADSVMTINLYFGKMPDSANYYLNIPRFLPGKVLRIIVPEFGKTQKLITLDISKKVYQRADGSLVYPKVYAIDLTPYIFPGFTQKRH
jgi:hypothetical protein